MLLGLRTAIYHTPDIAAGKLWYTKVLGFPPYFDQPFYVGFNVGGYELGLSPDGRANPPYGAYWGVKDIKSRATRGCSSSAPRRAPRSRTWAKAFASPTCSILGAMCSASSKTQTSNSQKQKGHMKRATGSFEVSLQPLANTEVIGAIPCWAAFCSPRNSAAISTARRADRCCRPAPPSKVRRVTWPSIRSRASSTGARAVSCCSTREA